MAQIEQQLQQQPLVKLSLISLAALGLLKTSFVFCKSLRALFKYFVFSRKNLIDRYGRGSWVLVTGASDGLGKQYAMDFAKDGFNIILMARNKDKTDRVAVEIEKQFNV